MTRILNLHHLAAGLLLLATCAVAARAQAPGATAAPLPSSGFGAHGISAVISGITATNERVPDVRVQLLLKNETSKNIALAAIAGQLATASTSTGAELIMREASGLPWCPANRPVDLAGCIKQLSPESYIEVDAGQSTGALLHFVGTGPGGQVSGTVSFTLRLLVRDLDNSDDALSSQASGKGSSVPHVVVINFPLIPLSGGG